MLKFSKIFLLVVIVLLGCGCAFFITAEKEVPIELVEAEESVEYESNACLGYDCLAETSGDSSQSNYFSGPTEFYTDDTIVVETVLINFNDFSLFNSSTYSQYLDKLDEVYQYFNTSSRGNLQVLFNINVCNLDEKISSYISREKIYYGENLLYQRCLESSVPIGENYGEPQVRLMIFSAEENFSNSASIFWPHAYPTSRLMVMNSNIDPSEICHELYHTIGILDLYIGNSNIGWLEGMFQTFFQPVGKTDIMAWGYNLTTPTSAYNRYQLGWLGSQTQYSDGETSAIEIINTSNTYIINEAMQTTGTIAYKFGANGNEFFLIECRKVNDENYLIVQRINTTYNDNLNTEDHSTCYIFTFPKNNSLYLDEGDTIGTNSHELYYSNNVDAEFSIGNIVDLGNNQIQFDFFTSTSKIISKTLNITSKTTGQTILNAVVKVNGITSSSNTISIKEGDTISVSHENYQTVSIIASGDIINLSSGDINVQMYEGNSIGSTFNLNIISDFQNYISNNNFLVYINNILQQVTSTINLKNGDTLKIVSDNTETYTSTYVNGILIDNSGNTTIENNTIQIELDPFVSNYYINVRDSNNNFVNITSLQLYNSFLNKWENFSNISIVYINNTQVYALKNVPFYYTKVDIGYSAYNTTTNAIADINVGNSYYSVQLDKNIIQNTGDFIFGIANNIKNWFA